MNTQAIIEAILFSAGEGVERETLAACLEMEIDELNAIMQGIIKKYDDEMRGVQILEYGNRYQMCTRADFYEYIRKLNEPKRQTGLSGAALECLSVIAYHQPATKSQVEYIRGVDCTGPMNRLCERGLIEEAGRLDTPGKPILYQTTPEFLRCFGLKSLDDLPSLDNLDLSMLEGLLHEEGESETKE